MRTRRAVMRPISEDPTAVDAMRPMQYSSVVYCALCSA